MGGRRGLRAKMAISYVLVTAAAVAVLEAVGLLLLVPELNSSAVDPSLIVQLTAGDLAGGVTKAGLERGRLPTADELRLGETGLGLGPDEAVAVDGFDRVRIPYLTGAQDGTGPVPLALLLDPDGTILISSYPGRFPAGGRFGGDGMARLEPGVLTSFRNSSKGGGGGRAETVDGDVYWAVAPVFTPLSKLDLPDAVRAYVYVQVPVTASLPVVSAGTSPWWERLLPPLAAGFAVLLVALPVGLVFGLLSTRSLIARLRRLAVSSGAVADGNYQYRVPISGADEVAQLERTFNRMAERLSGAMAAERQLATATERARIARELHDSISQDLFSLRLLAGGLRRALPAGSPLLRQVAVMERTATGTMHQMQALLLELRPVALTEAGLVPTLEALCQAYRDRLGVVVDARLDAVRLDPSVEYAVLRIVQEALTNAVKHARPERLTVRIRTDGEDLEVSVGDDGTGFDPEAPGDGQGMGLDLIRERVAELGGEFTVDSVVGEGTTLRIRLPRERP